MPKLKVHRSTDLNRIPRSITAKDGLQRLKDAGFELERERGGHRVMRRGGQTIILPSTGNCSPWLTQAIVKLESLGQGISSAITEVLPLTVMYRDKQYAVVDKRGPQYVLTNLDDGAREMAMVLECRPISAEDIEPRQVPAPEPPSEPEPEPGPGDPIYDKLLSYGTPAQEPIEDSEEEVYLIPSHPSLNPIPYPVRKEEPVAETTPSFTSLAGPQEAWVIYTQSLMDNYNEKIDALFAEIEELEKQRGVLEQAIKLVTGKEVAPIPQEVKRTILPPTGPPGPARPRTPFSQDEIDQIVVQHRRGKTAAQIGRLLHRNTSSIISKISQLRDEGKL